MTNAATGIDFTRLNVYCDEEDDRQLFFRFQQISELLGRIPEGNVRILPRGKMSLLEEYAALNALTEKDRPDFTFMYGETPFLIAECTEHGYTGDNPKQRFVRFRQAARARVPFIYFTPFSRVRDDELDRALVRRPSRRRVNTDVWKGMAALTEHHHVPIVPVEWPLAANGKARKLGPSPSAEVVREIYGEFVTLIGEIISTQATLLASGGGFTDSRTIRDYIARTKRLCEISNTRRSNVTVRLSRAELRALMDKPGEILNHVKRREYFHKGKGFKLVALASIDLSGVEWVVRPTGEAVRTTSPSAEFSGLLESEVFEEALVYYTGYEWRPDPHCGVAALLELLHCLAEDAVSHSKALVLHWPRVYYSAESAAYVSARDAIRNWRDERSHFRRVFVERYGEAKADEEIAKVLLDKRGDAKRPSALIGVWSERTKQARVFRDVCDLIILSDAVIPGDRWRK